MIFTTVLQQVIILLILIMLGFLLTKTGTLNAEGIKAMTDVALMLVTPCVIVKSFIRDFDKATLKAILISFFCGIFAHIVFIVIAKLLFFKALPEKERILRFAVIFSNCSFMSLPLQEAVLGDNGLLYGGAFITVFNVFAWSYGIVLMSGDRKQFSGKKIILNPGIIAVVVGLLIFFTQIKIPNVIYQSINYISALNTPLPMLIIGYHLANSEFIKGLKDKSALLAIAARLVILPLIVLVSLRLMGVSGDLLVSVTIFASAPTAAITTMFASKFNSNASLSVNIVSVSTVISLVTMPLLITLAMALA